MNCRAIQQDLALGAVGCLEPDRLLLVRKHCAECASCAARFREMELIQADHALARRELEGVPMSTPSRRREVSRAERSKPLAVWLRYAVPALAVLALALLLRLPPSRELPHPLVVSHPLATSSEVAEAPPPTLGNYRSALSGQGDATLDALLSRQQQHLLPRGADGDRLRLEEQL